MFPLGFLLIPIENPFSIFILLVGTPSTGRKKNLDLQFAQQPINRSERETDQKLAEIMKRNGILNINDEQHQTDSSDLIDMGELGSGTSGHVVKMRHKKTDTIIAVKVCGYLTPRQIRITVQCSFIYLTCLVFCAANATNGQ